MSQMHPSIWCSSLDALGQIYGNTEVVSIDGPIGSAPIGATLIGGTVEKIVVKIDNNHHDVVACVVAVRDLWERLITENSW